MINSLYKPLTNGEDDGIMRLSSDISRLEAKVERLESQISAKDREIATITRTEAKSKAAFKAQLEKLQQERDEYQRMVIGNQDAKIDREISEKMHLLQNFLKPEHLDIPLVLHNEASWLLISDSVRQVIMDAKVGLPSYEKGLAKDIMSIVGYIVMKDPSIGFRTNLLRMKGAGVAGVYHPLIDEKLVRILHGRNKKVYAWTVDDVVSMQKMLNEQVDTIVTSNHTLLQGLMQEIRTRCLEEGFSSNDSIHLFQVLINVPCGIEKSSLF